MKLFEVTKKKVWVKITDKSPVVAPLSKPLSTLDQVFFDHEDGMYAFCKDSAGGIVYPAMWTEVELLQES